MEVCIKGHGRTRHAFRSYRSGGISYEGIWERDQFSGYGVLSRKSYKDSWKEGKRGYGISNDRWNDDLVYEGEWAKNMKNGADVVRSANGRTKKFSLS
mmetsp:Transcript_27989/g.50157  ORF Transcript_27989/g.50157 Transcript_27989/m.50157 type:complete len:98 (-) Transcript_27989:5-298(-)